MKEITIKLYEFDELSEQAKEHAHHQWLPSSDFPWWPESVGALEDFCLLFGVSLLDYDVGVYGPSYVHTNAHEIPLELVTHETLDAMADKNGYVMAFDLVADYKKYRKSGLDSRRAFLEAVDSWKDSVVKEMEYYESIEYFQEFVQANDYMFTQKGDLYVA